jgi:hypothetical protein
MKFTLLIENFPYLLTLHSFLKNDLYWVNRKNLFFTNQQIEGDCNIYYLNKN